MKIGIVTLNGYFNYGNRLQNLALQETLLKMGHDVETIRLNKYPERSKAYTFLRKVYRRIKSIRSTDADISRKKREEIFRQFSFANITETSKEYQIQRNISELSNHYDYFVIGSDQVWNPSMNSQSGAFFADFADQKQKVSYAASFGVDSLNEDISKLYKSWLKDIPNISVREDAGARLIKKLTGKDVPVLVDPTLLLDKAEWLKYAKPSPRHSEKYLLTYFLGGIPEKNKIMIEELAKKNSLIVVNLGDSSEKIDFETGPAEFLDYINRCELFCTDSFHGVVFSIIFEKPFIVYERVGSESMYSRIETLLTKFSLTNRKESSIDYHGDIFNVNYEHTKRVIEKEKNKSMHFLVNALNNKG